MKAQFANLRSHIRILDADIELLKMKNAAQENEITKIKATKDGARIQQSGDDGINK